MTMWWEIPAMLAKQPDEELERMKAVCKGRVVKFARGPAKELEDATRMLGYLRREQRRRAMAGLAVRTVVH